MRSRVSPIPSSARVPQTDDLFVRANWLNKMQEIENHLGVLSAQEGCLKPLELGAKDLFQRWCLVGMADPSSRCPAQFPGWGRGGSVEPQRGGFGGKWLAVRKELQDLVMGHYLEEFRDLW